MFHQRRSCFYIAQMAQDRKGHTQLRQFFTTELDEKTLKFARQNSS